MTANLFEEVPLPTIPAVAIRVLELLAKPDVSTAEIADVVQTDPAITARILRAANSPAYGGRKVDSVDRAIVWLGRFATKSLALTFSLARCTQEGGALKRYFERYWLQSVVHATTMEWLAAKLDRSFRGTAFVSGLLMDVGCLALLQNRTNLYAPLLDRARREERRLADVELNEFGRTHAELSSELLSGWSLPEVMVDVARYHELAPKQLPSLRGHACFGQLAAANVAVATGDLLCGTSRMEPFRRLEQLTTELYGFSDSQLEEFLSLVSARLEETSDLLCTDTSSIPPTAEILARAREQLARLSEPNAECALPDGNTPMPRVAAELMSVRG